MKVLDDLGLKVEPHWRERKGEQAGSDDTETTLKGTAPQSPSGQEPEPRRPRRTDEDPEGYRGKMVGPYRLERELGRGGMGTVYLAIRDDEGFKMKVAVKLIRQERGSEKIIQRFLHERRILADLQHANIATLIDGGTTEEGLPYLVMEYVEGEPIDSYCRNQRLTIRKRLELFIKVCRAVEFTHRNGVIHRDLKPSNIMVTDDGEPILLDFGIAKILDTPHEERLTQPGDFIMTPEYASPEQVMGQTPDEKTDLYALGVLLYELLTDAPPYSFENRSIGEIQSKICYTDPVKPSVRIRELEKKGTIRFDSTTWSEDTKQRERLLAGDLDSIVLKALRKEPEHRYQSLNVLSDDLQRYLAGFPVKARGTAWSYRAGKFARRHRWWITAASVFAVLLVGFYTYVNYREWELAATKQAEQQQREEAEQAKAEARLLAAKAERERQQAREASAEKARAEQEKELAEQEHEEERKALKEERDRARLAWAEAQKARAEAEAEQAAAEEARQAEAELRRKAAEERERAKQAMEEAMAARKEAERQKLLAEQELGSSRQMVKIMDSLFQEAGTSPVSVNRILAKSSAIGSAETTEVQQIQARLMNLTGVVYLSRGRYDAADPLLFKSLELRQSVEAPNDEETATSLSNMGYLRYLQGRFQESEMYYGQALSMRRQLFGDNHIKIAGILSKMAMLSRRQGQYKTAWNLFKQSLTMQRGILGDKDPSVAETLANMAALHFEVGHNDKAVEMQQMSVQVLTSAYGIESAEVAGALSKIQVYCCQNAADVASERIMPRDIRNQLLAGEDEAILNRINNYAAALGDPNGVPLPAELTTQPPPGGGAPPPPGPDGGAPPPPQPNNQAQGGNGGNGGGGGNQASNNNRDQGSRGGDRGPRDGKGQPGKGNKSGDASKNMDRQKNFNPMGNTPQKNGGQLGGGQLGGGAPKGGGPRGGGGGGGGRKH
ncbi:serine/threonine-protein kinase [Sulfidibacter corallicola]|uniref:Serine/threonine protein kinase n=1 Tax=Sulfidibacter corallicola TaxID=2818388 RepID=A0A8A4TLK0_SULCO|nr:serine/threonine-protein kinase [Sulfidibacter corallicola]QTD50443.1 serine/threonine protein kinase [Sulfidibacter corallicola]